VNRGFSISEVAQQSGVSPDTLRFYERIGVLTDISRAKNGNRCYKDPDLVRIDFIAKMRRTGMPLQSIRKYAELLQSSEGTSEDTSNERLQILTDHRVVVARQIDDLLSVLSALDHKIEAYRDVGIRSLSHQLSNRIPHKLEPHT
jgi:DNA-binding transcriptional MerR regulator